MGFFKSNYLQIASEYYTPEEMSFKKRKKRVGVKKVRTRKLKADDLLTAPTEEDADFGSR